MKKAEIVEPNKPLRIVEADLPATPKKGAIVKVAFSGICHSDLHQWEDVIDAGIQKVSMSAALNYKLPIVPGHEISGTIHSFGEETGESELKVGDRVAVYPWAGCGDCGACKHDMSERCREKSKALVGVGADGGHATYVAVAELQHVVKLPDSIPLDLACMLPCSGVTTYNAVTSLLETVQQATLYHGKASVLIVGAGGLGLWSLQIGQALFPAGTKIVVADIDEDKLNLAKEKGCHDTICWSGELTEPELIKATMAKGNGGFDGVMDFVNTKVTAGRAFSCLKPYGMHAMIGLFGGEASFPLPMLVLGGKQVKGIFVGSLAQFKALIELVSKNKLEAPPLTYFNLEDITEGFNLLKDGKIRGRGLIKNKM
uniref:Enoyl reductase (ER) domain-containing protein n=1 Tax=Ciona savignyi TaxID=51511 RepID=H2YVW8_CIOSA